MEVRVERRAPAIRNFFSGNFIRALPVIGLKTSAETPKIPIRKPISTSVDPHFER
jgi:hypothetical protein